MSPGLTHLLRPETASFVISRRILTQEGFCEGEHRCGSPLDTLYANLPPSYEIFDHVDQKHSRPRMSTGERYEAGLHLG